MSIESAFCTFSENDPNDQNYIISRHYNLEYPKGLDDVMIHVVDFSSMLLHINKRPNI